MSNQANIQHNKLMTLDNTMLMYGIYNAETLGKLINTVQEIHNVTSSHEKLFAGEHHPTLFGLLYMDALGIEQYAFNLLLFLRIIQDKYISLYRELITQLHSYVSAIRVLAKGYLPTTLLTPRKLQEILVEVKKSLQCTNPDYTLVLDRLHLYYDMQLVTFGIDKDMNLVIQFPVFIQPYTQKPLILYQLDNHHLLESIASCDKKITKLTMYFTINLAFTNYLDMLPNLTEPLTLIRDRTHHEQTLPIHLNIPHYDNSLANRPSKMKEFLDNYIHSKYDKEIFDLQKSIQHTHFHLTKISSFMRL